MSADVERESKVIESVDELVSLARAGEKPATQHRVGTEHEKLPFYESTLAPVDYDNGIRRVLLGLVEHGWTPDPDLVKPIALKKNGASVTLEPGGQLELSGAPMATIHDTAREHAEHLREVQAVSKPLGIRYAALGYRPLESTDVMPWMPKERYRIMRAYLPTRGAAALEMMLLSATVQANLDYASEADMAEKLRVSMAISPVVAAMFACSPFVQGAWRGRRTRRYAMWRDVDRDRCGLLPFVFEKDFGYRDYIEWALDVPMFFLRRQGVYHATHQSFRAFLKDGFQGEQATLADFENHLSTLFPEVRLKTFLEVRSADASLPEMAVALAAFWKGILYDAAARKAAWELVKDLSFQERLGMQIAVAQDGLQGHATGWHAGDLAKELLALSRAGLQKQNARNAQGQDESIYLAPLAPIVESGVTLADKLIAKFGAGPFSQETARAILFEGSF